MKILALDMPGTKAGAWAIYCTDEQRVLEIGGIALSSARAERLQYRDLGVLLDRLYRRYRFRVVVLEHPFLYVIAGWVGAAKMWVSRRRGVRWHMLTASSAKKTVFGNGRMGKAEVLKAVESAPWSRGYHFLPPWTQHKADAAMYARAYAFRYPGEGSPR